MIKKILNILANAPNNTLSHKELIKRLKVRKKDIGAIKILIREIHNNGEIVTLKGNCYSLPRTPKRI